MYPTVAMGPPKPHVPRPRKYRRNDGKEGRSVSLCGPVRSAIPGL